MKLPAEDRDADLAGPLEEEGVTGQVSFEWACRKWLAFLVKNLLGQTIRRKSARLESV